MSFPDHVSVDARIEAVRANPAIRPPSGDFCRSCMRCGVSHCSDPSRVGEPGGCGAREPYDAKINPEQGEAT